MPTKPRFFNPEFYYHIYNCGVEKRRIFVTRGDYTRFLLTISFYLHDQRISYVQFQNLDKKSQKDNQLLNPKGLETLRVKLISYSLMPNHFHLVLKPSKEHGVTQFISDITNSHTRYFNIKNERIGSLLQGTFKSKEIKTEESVLQVTRYVHLNSISSTETNPYDTLKPEDYPFSSYKDWITTPKSNTKGLILNQTEIARLCALVEGRRGYKKFIEAKMDGDPEIGIEDLVIE